MPLPAALASRLAKRGLIKSEQHEAVSAPVTPASEPDHAQNNTGSGELEEEVIAEDYDDQKKDVLNNNVDGYLPLDPEKKFKGHHGCPNKYNIFHECSTFCCERWGNGVREPDPVYLMKKQKMLWKFPLPLNWKEVYDPGAGRHYYWDIETDEVSWLPPGHPRAKITLAAAHFREEIHIAGIDEDEDDDDDDRLSDDESESDESEEENQTENWRDNRDRRWDDRQRSRGGRTRHDNDLDPMDPAAYSDAPRGSWTSGLGKKNEAKTGADTTASGPLYQMRPYPSPGAVLRANAEAAKVPKTK